MYQKHFTAIVYNANENLPLTLEFENSVEFGPLGNQSHIEDKLTELFGWPECQITAMIEITPQAGGLISPPDVIMDDVVYTPADPGMEEQGNAIAHVKITADGDAEVVHA